MSGEFRVGITPDFYTEARGRFEAAVEQSLGGVPGLTWEPMPDQPGNVATPEALNRYDAIFALALRFRPESLRGVERLAVVARWGVGYDMIDTAALTQADVLLAITPGAVRRPVAEGIIAFVFALTTNLLEQDRMVRRGLWRGDLPRLGRNLPGRTLGSVGCGNIAQEMFRMSGSLGFGRRIAHDPYVTQEAAAAVGVELVSLDDVFRDSDFVTINLPLSAATRGLVGEREFRLMRPTACFINTSRGPIVQQAALTRALQERWIAGAGLDVFEVEPLPMDDPLRELDNVMLSPHGIAWTEELARDNGLEACANILAVARGQVPGGAVNREVLDRPGFAAKLARYRERG